MKRIVFNCFRSATPGNRRFYMAPRASIIAKKEIFPGEFGKSARVEK